MVIDVSNDSDDDEVSKRVMVKMMRVITEVMLMMR